jgi:hypothetical protein
MRKIFIILANISLIFLSCEKEEKATDKNQNEKITRLLLYSNTLSDNVRKDSIIFTNSFIIDFNKDDYSNLDSIKFVVVDFKNTTNKYINVNLYNNTDSSIIEDSEVTIPPYVHINSNYFTNDILNKFPNKPINIGIQVTYVNSTYINAKAMYLYLYRN